MATKILILVAPAQTAFSVGLEGAEACDLNKFTDTVKNVEANPRALLVATAAARKEGALRESLMAAAGGASAAFLRTAEEAGPAQSFLAMLAGERSSGVKACLDKGSTIFSESFFQAGAVGTKLDAAFKFARDRLPAGAAVDAWASLQGLVFLGLRNLPEQGEKGTGERVDVQVGADDTRVAYSVRFDLSAEAFAKLPDSSLLELPRQAAPFFELRYQREAKKAELVCVFPRQNAPAPGAVEALTMEGKSALEKMEDVKDYQFKNFGSLGGSEPKEKRVVKGAFKKKFSEQVQVVKADAPEPEKVTKVSAEKVSDPNAGNFLVEGEVFNAPEAKVTVSGKDQLAPKSDGEKAWEQRCKVLQEELTKKDGLLTQLRADLAKASAIPAAPPGDKTHALLASKIEGLELTLKQREELVAKLNKEIADIKDPMKMGVISSIKDNQLEGLKGNITRLQGEIAEAQGREKELLAVVDKAIQMKDEAVKRLKELETKLRSSQGGNNSKMVMLEKQMDEQKRQNKELSKRITQLTEQLQAAGKKAA